MAPDDKGGGVEGGENLGKRGEWRRQTKILWTERACKESERDAYKTSCNVDWVLPN